MTKCDFCEKSSPKGGCFWSIQSCREPYCLKAIQRMTEALKGTEIVKKIKKV